MRTFDHKKIEKKWRKKWEKQNLYKVNNKKKGKENFYALVEFPYPSGNLHIGHWYAFVVPDMFARYKRMQGFNVLFPIGFDSFGLPAENAAIKHGIDPRKWTYDNIRYMSEQLLSMGAMFDWDRKVVTSDKDYYKWTQWLFLKLYGKGLAYRAKAVVNWDPIDKTVLANEQVSSEGIAERSGALVEKRELEQWFFKITDYAERLIDDLEDLDWPEEIKEAQRNWIGKSEGALIDFPIKGREEVITVFTTRPDTLFGATYMVLAPEHKLVQKLKDNIKNWDEILQYTGVAAKKSEIERTAEGKEKTGVRLEGVEVINPATKELIPIFIADYVLTHYGTGAIMAVPAHDERDFEFARKYNLPIKQVVALECGVPNKKAEELQGGVATIFDPESGKLAVAEYVSGTLRLYGGGVDKNEDIQEGILREVKEESGFYDFSHVENLFTCYVHYYSEVKDTYKKGRGTSLLLVLKSKKQKDLQLEDHEKYKLRWVDPTELLNHWISRNENHDYDHWILFVELAVKRLQELGHAIHGETRTSLVFSDRGILIDSGKFSGLSSADAKEKITKHIGGRKKTTYKLRDWLISRQRYWGCPIPVVYDPKGKAHPIPEKHLPWLLPDDVDFAPTGKAPLASSKELKERTEKIFGKGWYPECDTMDTFVDSSWYFLRYIDPLNGSKFAGKKALTAWMPVNRYSGGVEHTTMHVLYSRFFHKALYDLKLVYENEPYKVRTNRGLILGTDGRKMSKRWGNVIDPDEQIKNVGADAVRLYLAFIGPYNVVKSYPWDLGGIAGMRRFLERVWREFQLPKFSQLTPSPEKSKEVALHQTIKKVTKDIENFKFNTAISSLMIFVGQDGLRREKQETEKYVKETFLKLLAPFAPHFAEELWERLGHATSIHLELWPTYNKKKTESRQVNITIQVNGKMRGVLVMPAGVSEEEVRTQSSSLPNVSKWFNEKEPSRVIFVPDRLINFVFKP